MCESFRVPESFIRVVLQPRQLHAVITVLHHIFQWWVNKIIQSYLLLEQHLQPAHKQLLLCKESFRKQESNFINCTTLSTLTASPQYQATSLELDSWVKTYSIQFIMFWFETKQKQLKIVCLFHSTNLSFKLFSMAVKGSTPRDKVLKLRSSPI